MGKRSNENAQMRREDYEAMENRGSSATGLGEAFSKASDEVLAGRRILKANAFKKKKVAETPSPTGPKNAFAGFSFKPTTSTSKSTATTEAAATIKSATATTTALENSKKLDLFREIKQWFPAVKNERKDRTNAYAQFLRTFNQINGVEQEETNASSMMEPPFNAGHMATKGPDLSSKDASSSLSLAAPLFPSAKPLFPSAKPAPTVPFSFTSSQSSGGGFSFSTTNETTASASGSNGAGFKFSLGGSNTGAVPGTTAPAGSSTTEANDATAEGGEEEPSAEMESADIDWTLVQSFDCKVSRAKEGSLKTFARGSLKLQRHKTDPSRRMILRDATGKVMLNLGINSAMSFKKEMRERKGRDPLGVVKFLGLMDKDVGAEMFYITCKQHDVDAMMSVLQQLASA